MAGKKGARITVRSIQENDLYCQTHPDWYPIVSSWADRVQRSFEKYPVLEETD